jgi:hypothetical protein
LLLTAGPDPFTVTIILKMSIVRRDSGDGRDGRRLLFTPTKAQICLGTVITQDA